MMSTANEIRPKKVFFTLIKIHLGRIHPKTTATSKDSTLSSEKVKSNIHKLKAVKFHIYEHHNNDWDFEQGLDFHEPIVWVFTAVYNPEAMTWEHSDNILEVIKSLTQKIICLTSIPRLSEP